MPLSNLHSLSSSDACSSSVHGDSCSALTARLPRAEVLTTFGCLGSDLKKQVFTHFLFPDAKMRTSFESPGQIFKECCVGFPSDPRTSADPCWKADDADGKFCQKNSDLKDTADSEQWKTENINPIIAAFNKQTELEATRAPSHLAAQVREQKLQKQEGWSNRDMTWQELKTSSPNRFDSFKEQAFKEQQGAIIFDFAKKYLDGVQYCDGHVCPRDNNTAHVEEGKPCVHQSGEDNMGILKKKTASECKEGLKCKKEGDKSVCKN